MYTPNLLLYSVNHQFVMRCLSPSFVQSGFALMAKAMQMPTGTKLVFIIMQGFLTMCLQTSTDIKLVERVIVCIGGQHIITAAGNIWFCASTYSATLATLYILFLFSVKPAAEQCEVCIWSSTCKCSVQVQDFSQSIDISQDCNTPAISASW